MKRVIAPSLVLVFAVPVALAQPSRDPQAPQKAGQQASQPASRGSSGSPAPGGSAAGAETQSAESKKPQTGDYYQSNENKADPNLKQEKRKEKEEGVTSQLTGRARDSGGRCLAG